MTTPTSNTDAPTTVWCGGCSSVPDDPDATTCGRCGCPLVGIVADRLRSLTVDHDVALRERRTDDAYDLAMEHTRLKARSTLPAAPPRVREPVPASKVVSWLGAGLVVAGGIAFTAVVWNVAGGAGRLAILALVTLLAFAGAWLLRRRTPVTAEALTLVAAGTVVVDAVVPVVAGYVTDDAVTPWFAATSLAAATLMVLLGRLWESTTARVAGTVLSSAAGAAAVVMVLDVVEVTSEARMLAVAGIGALLVAGVVVAADLLDRWSRTAVLAGAWTAWLGLGLGAVAWDALGALGGAREGGAWGIALAMLALSVAPLAPRPRTLAGGAILGVLGAGASAWAVVVLTTRGLLTEQATAPVGIVASSVVVAVVAVVGLALGRDEDGAATARRRRGTVLGLLLALAWATTTTTALVALARSEGLRPTAYALLGVAAVAAVVRAAAARILPGPAPVVVESLAAATGLAGVNLLVTSWTTWPGGLVAAVASVVASVASLLVPERNRTALWAAAATTLVLAPVLGTTAVEQLTVPAAAVALVLGVQLGRSTGATSSWATELPAAALLLLPSLWVGVVDGDVARMATTAVAATGVLVVSGWRHRQGPTVAAVATLVAVAVWALAPHASDVPLWAVLTGCGALLLWVGFTCEARRTTARHLLERWSEWT